MTTVAILMGSNSDRDEMQPCFDTLKKMGISFRIDVASAHRTPAKVMGIIDQAPAEGIKLFICAAGHAAHLAGVVAAHTELPVVAVPIASSALNGMDALLSTVMMPPGMPVATMAMGKSGAKNAALFAAQVLGLSDDTVAQKLHDFRANQTETITNIATEFVD